VNVSKPGIQYPAITVAEGYTHYIHARDSIGQYFQWLPMTQLNNYNSRFANFTAINDVQYEIRISDIHTCVTIDTLQMLVLKKPGYYLPTAFTPNGDGLNDVARPYLVRMKSLVSFSVFDRWGKRIFFTQQDGKGWDGKFEGVTQPTGVYVWILEFMDTSNQKVTEKGTITLIR
jgi:gliding motility-associated-like protein